MVAISSTSETISEYKRLLVSEWGKRFPDEVLGLLWKAISVSRLDADHLQLSHLLDPKFVGDFPRNAFQSTIDQMKEAKRFIRFPRLPELPGFYEQPKRMAKDVWIANRLASYLALPAHAAIEGDIDFFADMQSLAFQAAIHYVLPSIRVNHQTEHSILLHGCALYAFGYSAFDLSHYAYMMSMLFDYIGDDDSRLRFLFASFRSTPPTDHSYLTKAQEYWTELLHGRKHEEAETFLFSLHWWSLPDQQEEIREMFTDAMKHILQAKNAKRVPG